MTCPSQVQLEIQVVATKASLHFFDITKLPVKCYTDEEEWVIIIIIIVVVVT